MNKSVLICQVNSVASSFVNPCHYGTYKFALCTRQTPAPTTSLLHS